MLNSIISGVSGTGATLLQILICTACSLVLGFLISLLYMHKNAYTKSFVITLTLLPAIVQAVIMMVNGNVGTGVAVAGAFSLVRFRSAQGSAREITALFLAMALGLATGMGYIAIAFIFLILIGGAMLLLNKVSFGEKKDNEKTLRVTIPENLEYTGLFDDLFGQYTKKAELERVKLTNMGSLYELQYNIILKNPGVEKELIDEIRCRNGNLNIVCGRVQATRDEL